MTSTPRAQFVEARTRAERERTDQQQRAVRTVAGNARDHTEYTALLAMLGLKDPAPQPLPLSRRLADYVHQVAEVIGVPADAVGHEVTDTATAYIALAQRCVAQPDHDLMLVWDERLGWYIAAETAPTESPIVMAYLAGEAVPPPAAVARFVTDTADGRHMCLIRPVLPPAERTALAEKMAAH
ncbi:DUF6292 family protein [Actinophytocola glycyrrhizae]|uniref:DUF6292 family protein n=1 Tax=Actinophytocola glycyrrhizae TaxID=2044873 RepID=A0ABV9S7V9_9PSEU